MDLLLSIPLASYFLAPSVPSFTTTLNMLFFYMTWTTLIFSHSPLRVHMTGVLSIRVFLWLVPSLFTLALELLFPSITQSVKHGGRAALPPRSQRTISRTLFLALLNLAILTLAEGACSYAHGFLFRGAPPFRTSMTLPLPWKMTKHIALLFLAREVLQYYIHRYILHSSSRGRASSLNILATLHGQYAHARGHATPFSLLLFTDHPLPMLLHRFVPVYAPAALVVRPHLLTYFLFVALCTLEDTLAQSGYTIVPGFVMSGIGQRCAVHYASGGSANFGAYGILDWLHGTGQGRDVLDDLQKEAEKQYKASGGGGASLLQNGLNGLNALRGSSPKKTSPKRR